MLTEGKRKRNDIKSEPGFVQSKKKNDYHYVIELEASSSTTVPGSDYSAGTEDEANNTDTNYIRSTLTNLANNTDVEIIIKDKKHKMHKKHKEDKKNKKNKLKKLNKKAIKHNKAKKNKKDKEDKKDKKDKKEKKRKKENKGETNKKNKKHKKEKRDKKDTDMKKAKL